MTDQAETDLQLVVAAYIVLKKLQFEHPTRVYHYRTRIH